MKESIKITKILEKMRAGINPERMGTSAVASDQARTPTSRTFLQKKGKPMSRLQYKLACLLSFYGLSNSPWKYMTIP